MEKVSIIGLDLAKRSFQLHGARADGGVAFRKKLSRDKVLTFLAKHPRCVVAMEACGSAHHWGRAIGASGHEVRLIPPAYVKPFIRRQKNDAADAEAICEAAVRPAMRFVAVKTEEQQARAMLFRTRDLLVRQRTPDQCATRSLGRAWRRRAAGTSEPEGPCRGNRVGNHAPSASRRRALSRLSRPDRRAVEDDRRTRKGDGSGSHARNDNASPANHAGRGTDHARWRLRLSRRRWPSSDAAATLPPGSGLFPGNIRQAASRFSARSRRWASVTSGAC